MDVIFGTAPGRCLHTWGKSRRRRLAIGLIGAAATALTLFVTSTPTAQAAPPPPSFAVSGLTSVAAGTAQTVKVTALNKGKLDPGYQGTVVLTSTDGQAVLPAPYKFTKQDKGVHSFSVTLKTSGSQRVTATDAASSARTGSQTVTVSPAAATSLTLAGLVDAPAGTQSVVVTARDPYGNVANGYTGTVAFSSSDPQAILPSNYAFTAADAGSHSFGVTLKTAGQQSVSVTDQANSLSSSQTKAISSGLAVALNLTTDPAMGQFEGSSVTTAGQTFNVILTAVDAYGNRATGYTGTVDLKSTDALTQDGIVQFGVGDAGRVTRSGIAFFAKKIYEDHASLTAVDTNNSNVSGALTFQVRPGPAVRYSPCTQPELVLRRSRSGQPHSPIGVNDALGTLVTALDAYGNDATVRQRIIVGSLAPGYQGTGDVTSSDDQVANVIDALFHGTGGASLAQFTLRTAGQQTVTITDSNAGLTRTCSYTVVGPKAFTGTISLADPKTTRQETVWLAASTYLPPNDLGLNFESLNGPYVDNPNGGLSKLGTFQPVGVIGQAGAPLTLAWNLNPALPPPGTLTCNRDEPCVTGAPVRIPYTIQDDWGNTSSGIITVEPWNAVVPSPGINWDDDGANVLFTNLQSEPLIFLSNVPLDGTVTSANPAAKLATVRVGADATMEVATPTSSSLIVGAPVNVRVTNPLTVTGNIRSPLHREGGRQEMDLQLARGLPDDPLRDHDLTAFGVVCEVSSFAGVTLTYYTTSGDGQRHLNLLDTVAYNMCGVIVVDDGACAHIGFSFSQPDPGLPPVGRKGHAYPGYLFHADSSSPADHIAFIVGRGDVPPGLEVRSDGHIVPPSQAPQLKQVSSPSR